MVFGECTSAVLMDSVENELLSKRFLVEAKHIFKFTNIYVSRVGFCFESMWPQLLHRLEKPQIKSNGNDQASFYQNE